MLVETALIILSRIDVLSRYRQRNIRSVKLSGFQNVERGMMPPEKRKDGSFSPTLGRPCKLEANHFILEALRKIKVSLICETLF